MRVTRPAVSRTNIPAVDRSHLISRTKTWARDPAGASSHPTAPISSPRRIGLRAWREESRIGPSSRKKPLVTTMASPQARASVARMMRIRLVDCTSGYGPLKDGPRLQRARTSAETLLQLLELRVPGTELLVRYIDERHIDGVVLLVQVL